MQVAFMRASGSVYAWGSGSVYAWIIPWFKRFIHSPGSFRGAFPDSLNVRRAWFQDQAGLGRHDKGG